jgi:tetratricopeptide (TPR) repeat protein
LWFWHIRGHGQEGIDWLERLLVEDAQAQGGQVPGVEQRIIRAKALEVAGFLLEMQNRPQEGRVYISESLDISRDLGQAGRRGEASALLRLAGVTDDIEQKTALYLETLALARKLKDAFLIAEALQGLGFLAINEGRFQEGQVYLEENLALRQKIDDLDGMGTALLQLGSIAYIQGKIEDAEKAFADSLDCFHKVGNMRFVSEALFSQAMLAFSERDFERATEICEQAIAIGQDTRERSIVAVGIFRLGRVSMAQGNYDLAIKQYQEVMEIAQETGFKPLLAMASFGLAVAAVSQRRYPEAYAYLKEASEYWLEVHDYYDSGFSLMIMAELAYGLNEIRTAAQLIGAAEHILPSSAFRMLSPVEADEYYRVQQAVRETLGEAEYQQAWAEGQEMTLEQALNLALSLSQKASQ